MSQRKIRENSIPFRNNLVLEQLKNRKKKKSKKKYDSSQEGGGREHNSLLGHKNALGHTSGTRGVEDVREGISRGSPIIVMSMILFFDWTSIQNLGDEWKD